MKHNITLRIREDYVGKDKKALINAITYIKGKRVKMNTHVHVKPQDFDSKKQIIKGSGKKVQDDNLILQSCLNKMNEIFIKYRLLHKDLSAEIFRKEYKNPSSQISFTDYIEYRIAQKKGMVTDSTIKQLNAALSKLNDFRKKVLFEEFDIRFIEDFEKYMKISLKNNKNTRNNTLKRMKLFLNDAVKDDIIKENPFNKIKLINAKTSREYLTKEELSRLHKYYDRGICPEKYHKVLRVFLFQCYTGMRFSDIKSLQLEMISNNKVYFTPLKTKNVNNQTLIIPLIQQARQLIKHSSDLKLYGPAFDALSEQRTNLYLKEIMKANKIDKNVTTHVGRHTFATLFYEKTSDVAALQKLLGHSRITATMIYAHVSEAHKEKQMKCFEEMFD